MERVKIIIMNGTAYVWSAEEWMRIRDLRILGNFVGSLAALPRQYQLAGLPLALLKEETTILVEKGYAETKLIRNISNPPDEEVQNRSSNYLRQLFSEQTELMKAKRKQEIESKIEIILKGKRAKRRRPEEVEKLNRESVLEEEFKKLESIQPTGLAIQICTSDPWVDNNDYEDCPWNYPTNEKEQLHYSIFKDLWEKGYYITPGGKFGGDYLVYPGDPIKFHALFIVICCEKTDKIKMSDIVTYGRLGQSVRKTVVLGYLNNNEVCYQSVQWSGF